MLLGITRPSEKPVSIGYVGNIAKLVVIMLISERRGVASFAYRLHAVWNNQNLMLLTGQRALSVLKSTCGLCREVACVVMAVPMSPGQ